MFEGDYSKKVWIITIVMAIGSLVMDIFFLMKGDTLMRDTVWITMPIAAYILFKAIQGLIKKIKEEMGEE